MVRPWHEYPWYHTPVSHTTKPLLERHLEPEGLAGRGWPLPGHVWLDMGKVRHVGEHELDPALEQEAREAWGAARTLAQFRNKIAHRPIVFGWHGPAEGEPDYIGINQQADAATLNQVVLNRLSAYSEVERTGKGQLLTTLFYERRRPHSGTRCRATI